jgi:hypothetical protein
MEKKDKVRVLVFPCGSEIGLEIHEALKWSTYLDLYGASTVPSNHGKYVYKNYFENLPYVDEVGFFNNLNNILDEYEIDFIYPAHDSVVVKLSENLGILRSKVIGSPVETCKICRSKGRTYDFFRESLIVPEIFESSAEELKFPVFLKPDIGQGSKGVFIAHSQQEVDFFKEKNNSLIMMEYLPGPEYTVDCFTDRNRVLRFVGPRERMRISNGISVNTHPINDKRFIDMANIINEKLEFRGGWFFQTKKKNNGDIVLLEVSPRISGSMGLYRNMGVNFPLLSIFDRLDFDLEIYANNFSLEMDRALLSRYKVNFDYGHVYIDLDDTLIFKGVVNQWVIAFLYQCLNKGIKIHLLSRHKGGLKEVLQKYRLAMIFDSIENLDESQEKVDYIKENSSIFIDDSFSERQKVFVKLGIPTFDVNSIFCLVDWRF